MNITIQKATSKDAGALLEYLKQIGGETDNLSFGEEGVSIGLSEEIAYLSKLENSKDAIILLAKDNEKIVGDASLTRLQRRMSHRGNLGMAVLKEYWSRGIGESLLCKIIDLQVRSDTLSLIYLYEKYEFKKLCTYPKFFKIEDEFIGFDLMYLELE